MINILSSFKFILVRHSGLVYCWSSLVCLIEIKAQYLVLRSLLPLSKIFQSPELLSLFDRHFMVNCSVPTKR